MRLPFIQLKQDAIVKARTMARLLKIPAYAGIGLAGELFVWAVDMAPENDDGQVDWSGDLGKEDPAPLVAAAVGWDGDPDALLAAMIRVGFVQASSPHLRKNARVKGLDIYEATHAKALKDRERKRVHRKSTGSREDGAGQTQTQTQTQEKLLSHPHSEIRSGDLPKNEARKAEAHWDVTAEQLVAWMVCERDLRVELKSRPTVHGDLDAATRWALDWALKHEPDERAVEQMHRAFLAFLDDPLAPAGRSLSVWCSDNVGAHRFDAERLKSFATSHQLSNPHHPGATP